jgi:Gram-negative bacterial TonB protein C-terminal
MTRSATLLLLLLLLCWQLSFAQADTGTCPAPQRSALSEIPKRDPEAAPMPGMRFVGSVVLVLSLSDTGAICELTVLKSLNPELDKQAIALIRRELFQPIRVDDKPVPGSMTVFRDFWHDDKSNTDYSETANAAPEDIPSQEQSPKTLTPTRVLMKGEIDGSTYRNEYLSLTISVPEAELVFPTLTDPEASVIRLVTAISTADPNEFSISLIADSLSNYPALREQHEYVDLIAGKLRPQGTRAIYDTSPFMISNVQFMGTIWKAASNGQSKRTQYRGLFCAPRKGYWLSLDITAPTEQEVIKLASSLNLTAGRLPTDSAKN